MFPGIGGRPRRRDFQRQNRRNTVRCHLRKVSGFTITSASRQSKNLARASIVRRNQTVVLRGLAFRSRNSASCLRKNKISAKRASRGKNRIRQNVSNPIFYKRLRRPLLQRRIGGSIFCGPQLSRWISISENSMPVVLQMCALVVLVIVAIIESFVKITVQTISTAAVLPGVLVKFAK